MKIELDWPDEVIALRGSVLEYATSGKFPKGDPTGNELLSLVDLLRLNDDFSSVGGIDYEWIPDGLAIHLPDHLGPSLLRSLRYVLREIPRLDFEMRVRVGVEVVELLLSRLEFGSNSW